MTLTELKYIVTLAQEEHFGKAAQKCHVSQPTLSIAVKKLEDELGIILFERAKSRVQPTAVGLQIIERARQMLDQAAEIRDLATSGVDQLSGPLAVGTLTTIGPYLLPQFIPLLQKTAPKMPLFVEEEAASILGKKLRQGELDVVIAVSPFAETDVVTQVLFDEPFVVMLPAGHALVEKTAISEQDLFDMNLLIPGEGQCFREQLFSALPSLRMQQIQAHRLVRSGTLETLRHMVASGLGTAILPLAAAQIPFYATNLVVIRPFCTPAPKRTLVLAWRASFPRYKAIDVLRNAVQSCSPAYWRFSTGKEANVAGILVENRDW